MHRAVAAVVLALLGLLVLPGIAAASSACPTCIGHRDKVGGDYVVKAGDTLSGIAAARRVPGGAARLYARNGDVLTSPDRIYVGQRLLVGAPLQASVTYTLIVDYNGRQIERTTVPNGGNILYKIVPNGSSAVVVPQSPTPNGAVYVANSTRSTAQVTVLRNGTVIRDQPVPSFGQLSFRLTATRYRS